MSKFNYQRPLNLAEQAAAIRRGFPGFETSTSRGALIAKGRLTPSAITNEYVVRIEYRWEKAPKVFVEAPQLARRPDQPDTPIPHTYDFATPGRERPCVFYPRADWHPGRSISQTVIPWLMCWLLDYECWRATGTWRGGGLHLDIRAKGLSK